MAFFFNFSAYKEIIFLILLNFVSGCRKDTLYLKNNNVSVEHHDDFIQQEAKNYDVSIPLDAIPIANALTQNSYGYSIKLSAPELISYYNFEMENFGWRKIAEFNSFETLLIFSKPNDRMVAISIRPIINLDIINVFILF